MSGFSRLHPYLRTGDWWTDMTPSRLFDQNFGSHSFDDPFFDRGFAPSYYRRGYRTSMDSAAPAIDNGNAASAPSTEVEKIAEEVEKGFSEVHNEKDKFTVKLDMSHFAPEEIKVKTTENGLVVSGQHEEKMDEHGFVSRSFSRRYVLPKDIDPATLTSQLTPNGVLYIEAPKKMIQAPTERSIQIQLAKTNLMEHRKKGH